MEKAAFTAMYLINCRDYQRYERVLALEKCPLCKTELSRMYPKRDEGGQSIIFQLFRALPGVLCSKFA